MSKKTGQKKSAVTTSVILSVALFAAMVISQNVGNMQMAHLFGMLVAGVLVLPFTAALNYVARKR